MLTKNYIVYLQKILKLWFTKKLKNCVKKYDGKLPLITNQKYNAYLKEIQKLAGIKTVITTHLLRKTYAHYMLNNGVRIETVARLLGHSNSLITQKIYCRKTTETIAKEIEGLNII